jgi:type I restriction enzyme S subunit
MKAFQDSGFQWIGRIPLMWQVERIKRLVSQKITDGPHETPTLEEEGIPFISAEAIKSEKIDFDKKRGFISLEQHEIYSKKCKPQRNDIFIIKSGATTGNVAYVDTDIEFNIWSPLAVVRCDEKKAYYKFVFYQLLSDVFRKQVELSWSFGTQENIGMGVIGRINLVIPPIIDQYRIASYLDKTCAAIDKAIEAKQKQIETLDALRKSIIHKAVTRGLDDSVELKDSGIEWLGRIPKHWDCQHLKRGCSRIQTGSTPPTANTEYYVDGTIPWYAPGCYDGGIYLQEPAKEINEIAYFNNKLRLYPAHSIFIVGIGATIGKVAMTRVEASCNQQITALVCNSDVYAKYLTYHLKIFESIIPRVAQFTTLPIIDQNKIGYLPIALPPIKEQEQIAKFLDDKVAMNDRLENNLVKQISTLQQYRKSLIHECVTGKRRITEDHVQD